MQLLLKVNGFSVFSLFLCNLLQNKKMNEETIEEMLDSSFDFDFSSDDSDNDPNWDAKNAEIMSTSKLFYLKFNKSILLT